MLDVWFLAALGVFFLAGAARQAGAARSPEEERPRTVLDKVLWFATMVTLALLLAHAALAATGRTVWLVLLPIAALVAGAFAGGMIGASLRGPMRALGMLLAVAALGLAAYAAAPNIIQLTQGAGGLQTAADP